VTGCSASSSMARACPGAVAGADRPTRHFRDVADTEFLATHRRSACQAAQPGVVRSVIDHPPLSLRIV
jgi:hypothetical protein